MKKQNKKESEENKIIRENVIKFLNSRCYIVGYDDEDTWLDFLQDTMRYLLLVGEGFSGKYANSSDDSWHNQFIKAVKKIDPGMSESMVDVYIIRMVYYIFHQ